MENSITTIVLAASLLASGCSTALSRACMTGQPLGDMSPAQVCQAAQVEQQQQTNALTAAVGAAVLIGAAGIAVGEAYHRTYIVEPPPPVIVY